MTEKIARRKSWTMVRIGTVRGMSEQQPEFWHSKLVVRLCENKTRRRQFCTADEDCKPVHGVRLKASHASAEGGC